MRGSVQRWSAQPHAPGPASSNTCSSSSWAGLSRQRAPPGPLDASAGRPPAASARRHRLADIRVTRKRVATSRSVALSSIHAARLPTEEDEADSRYPADRQPQRLATVAEKLSGFGEPAEERRDPLRSRRSHLLRCPPWATGSASGGCG